ncbi:acyltransferase [Paenibacillus agricola]|uniref:Acyltransferase n=1 Tax=Paenibacillus agricola TaxID=2716264 RepID=A0ABX0J8D7_9BACL|nr:acyltransferase [Paenibacillus agricola]NHN31576.1 acyltransferase [Paenibacillus agricola]
MAVENTAKNLAAAKTATKKPKLLELDIVRGIAILAVLVIHGTSEATVEIPIGSISQAFYLGLNKLGNFAVPLFILMSGLVLFYRYIDDWSGKQAVNFYLKRVKQILFPYLLWSLFYYVYNQWMYDRENLHWDWQEFLDMLPWADASYHLYFMVIIVQFYLVFPLLIWICRAWKGFRNGLFVFGIAVQVAAYSYERWVEPFDHSASLCVTYFSLFTLGGFIGMHYDACIAFIQKHIAWILPVTVLLGASFMSLFLLEQSQGIIFVNLWYAVIFNLYPMFAALSFIWLGRKLLKHAAKLAQALISLGAASFGIYLMHPALLSYWRQNVPHDTGSMMDYHLYTMGAFLVSLFLPWLLVSLYGMIVRKLKPPRRTIQPQRGTA